MQASSSPGSKQTAATKWILTELRASDLILILYERSVNCFDLFTAYASSA